jgi:hypothetical protein
MFLQIWASLVPSSPMFEASDRSFFLVDSHFVIFYKTGFL